VIGQEDTHPRIFDRFLTGTQAPGGDKVCSGNCGGNASSNTDVAEETNPTFGELHCYRVVKVDDSSTIVTAKTFPQRVAVGAPKEVVSKAARLFGGNDEQLQIIPLNCSGDNLVDVRISESVTDNG
jgi:hypothetical protein